MRVYRWLARAFPPAFRRHYAAELEAAAADLLRAEGGRNPLRRARLWIGLAADALTRGFAERRAERTPHAHAGTFRRSLAAEWRQAVRGVVGRPGLSLTVIGLLALVMSANAAVFGVVSATLLRPLPYKDPDRLVMLWESYAPMKLATMPWSDPDYISASAAQSFAGTAVFRSRPLLLTGQGEPASLRAATVEGTLFDVLGAEPALGRLFTKAESDAGTNDVVVLSHALWVERFHADPAIVGQHILLDNQPRTVIGVLGQGVSFPPPITFSGQMISSDQDLYVPYKPDTTPAARGSHSNFVVARLRDGVALSAAQAELSAIDARLEREFPDTNTDVRMRVDPLHGQSVVAIRSVLFTLLAAVAGVLLVACASIANLMLARASGRAREMALRTALGASRGSLVRQLLLESALLGICGTTVGLLGAQWLSKLLMALNPIELPAMFQSSLDWRVLAFTLTLTMVAVVAFGLVPAVSGSRADLVSMLRSGTRLTAGRGERRTKSLLVVVQVALAVVLLVSSGLMVRSVMRLWQVDPGFRPDGVVTTSVALPPTRYGTPDQQRQFQERWVARLRQIPGVSDAAVMTLLPFSFDKNGSDYDVVGLPPHKPGEFQFANYSYVSSGFASVLGIPVLEGRSFSPVDQADAPLVTLISESLAKRHWPSGGAVGHQLVFNNAEHEQPKTIIGVVGDVRLDGFDGAVAPTIYVPVTQAPVASFWTVLASRRSPGAIADDVRAAVHDLDPGLPAGKIRPLTDIMGDTVKKPRFAAIVLTAFGLAALVIAAVGLYGVLAFDVTQQRRELGVRVALGATPHGIRALVLGRGYRLVAAGLVVGALASLVGARLISGLLFDAPAFDLVPLAAATLSLLLTTLVATWLPARRATRADPIEALRAD